jgi:hypothetical protein
MSDWLSVPANCRFCYKEVPVMVRGADLVAWRNGRLAQQAFPYLSADQRELLISGVCGLCWDSQFDPNETSA